MTETINSCKITNVSQPKMSQKKKHQQQENGKLILPKPLFYIRKIKIIDKLNFKRQEVNIC